MKQDTYLPLKILKQLTTQYPKAWEQMANFHHDNGLNGLPSWPDWCYTPMSSAIAVATRGIDMDAYNNLPTDTLLNFITIAQVIFALAPWRLSKEVYVVDKDLKNLLFQQAGELDIPDEILLQLPYPCFYVEIPDTYFRNEKIHGFFVTLEYDINNGDRELKPVFLTESGAAFSYSIHIGCKTIAESVELLNEQSFECTRGDKRLEELAQKGDEEVPETIDFLKKIFQVILYILAQNADITPDPEQATITKRGKTIKDKYSEIRKWDVGFRIGNELRKQKFVQSDYQGGTHNSPRPHIRRGHWHHFWTGPKKDESQRKLILKWLSPMAIAVGDNEDSPVVIHKVK